MRTAADTHGPQRSLRRQTAPPRHQGLVPVVFAIGDAYYHAHRALVSFVDFPRFLAFDPCLNWPDGAAVPYPPLFDLVSAGLARVFSDSIGPAISKTPNENTPICCWPS